MKKYTVEFIGTFYLVLTICMTVIGGAGSMAPVAIGFALMVMIFAGGHISGAHYNPAVTLAVLIRGKCSLADVPGYIIAQLAGASLAAYAAKFLLASILAAAPVAVNISTLPAFVAEFLGTFALAYVVLNVATSKGTSGNSFYGLAIGATVTACAYALGPVSGGAFNPAVALGACIAGLIPCSASLVIVAGNFVGAALAAAVFLNVTAEDDK